MDAATLALLALAGVGAGLAGTVAGLASVVSYPALLAAGLAPIAANVTNTVALLGNAVGGIHGSRPELAGQGARVRRLVPPALAGGVSGGVLLLLTPAEAFERIVPWLIGLASLAVLLRPRPEAFAGDRGRHDQLLWWGVLLVGVYCGYFGAAGGVVLLAVVLWLTGETVARASAVRLVLLSLANAVAAVTFAIAGPVHWPAAVATGVGFVAGSRLGPVILRHSPDRVLRGVIAVAGLAVAVRLGIDAY
jgi:uncharacterized membrane protein YfcA